MAEKAFIELGVLDRVLESQKLWQYTYNYYDSETWYRDDGTHGFFDTCDLMRSFYDGSGQWSETARETMIKENRQPTTYNMIISSVNMLSGLERGNRTETRAVPTLRNQGEQLVDIVNPFLKYSRKENNLTWNNSEGFKDSLIVGAFHYEAGLKQQPGMFDDDLELTFIPAENFLWDPARRMIDNSDAMFGVHFYWISAERFESLYGDIPDSDLLEFVNTLGEVPDIDRAVAESGDAYKNNSFYSENDKYIGVFNDKSKQRIRMLRIWRKYRLNGFSVKIAGDNAWEFFESEKDANAYRAKLQQTITDREIFIKKAYDWKICYHVIAGKKEIEFKKDIGLNEIPIKSHYCRFNLKTGKYWGLIQEVKDNQEVINQLYATLLELIKQMPKITLEYEENALTDESEQKLKKRGFVHGLTLKYKSGKLRSGAARVTAALGLEKFTAMIPILADQKDNLKNALGARDVLEGGAPKNVGSGIGLQILRQQGLLGSQELFDHFTWFKESIAKLQIRLMYMMDPDYVRLIVTGNLESNYDISQLDNNESNRQKPLNELVSSQWDSLFKKLKYSKYQFSTEQVAYNPSEQLTRLQIMIEFSQTTQIPIPPEMAIDYSLLSEEKKEYWKKWLQAQGVQNASPEFGANGQLENAGALQQAIQNS